METMWQPEYRRISALDGIDIMQYTPYYNTPNNTMNDSDPLYKENVVPNTRQVKRRVSFSLSSPSCETPKRRNSSIQTPQSSTTPSKGTKRTHGGLPSVTPASVSRKILKKQRLRRGSSFARSGGIGRDGASQLLSTNTSFMTRGSSPGTRLSVAAVGRMSSGTSLGLPSAKKIAKMRRKHATAVLEKVIAESTRKSGKRTDGLFCFSMEDGFAAQEDALTFYLNFILVPEIAGSPRCLAGTKGSLADVVNQDGMKRVLRKIEGEINSGRLFITKKISVNSDIGVQERIIELFLANYHPIWLMVGFAAITNINVELDPRDGNCSELEVLEALEFFMKDHILKNDGIRRHFIQNGVLNKRAADSAQNGHTLKHVLGLIYLLDVAKQSKEFRIPGDIPLFRADSVHRSSQDVLLEFSDHFLSEQGDILRFLSYKSYTLSYEENDVGAVDMTITNLFSDLRDGIRLAKLASIITGDRRLLDHIKLVTSPLQNYKKAKEMKLKNLGFAISCLARFAKLNEYPPIGGSTHDFVEGRKNKVLPALWNIVKMHDAVKLLNVELLRKEIKLVENDFASGEASESSMHLHLYETDLTECEELLLLWAATVTAKYDLTVRDFTESFRDGCALCIILHHYKPDKLPLSGIGRYLDDAEGEEAMEVVWNNLRTLQEVFSSIGIPNIPLTVHQALDINVIGTKRETFGNPVQVILSNMFYHLASVNSGSPKPPCNKKVFTDYEMQNEEKLSQTPENRSLVPVTHLTAQHVAIETRDESLKKPSSESNNPVDVHGPASSILSPLMSSENAGRTKVVDISEHDLDSPVTPVSGTISPKFCEVGRDKAVFAQDGETRTRACEIIIRVLQTNNIVKKIKRLAKEQRLMSAVVLTQSHYRGLIVKKTVEKIQSSVKMIQRCYRGFRGRAEAATSRFSTQRNDEAAVQAGNTASFEDESIFLKEDSQRMERMMSEDRNNLVYVDRNIASWQQFAKECDLAEKSIAVSLIQQVARSCNMQGTLATQRLATLHVQSLWRARCILRQLHSSRECLLLIQAAARRHKATVMLKDIRKGMLTIRTAYRYRAGLIQVRKRCAVKYIERAYIQNVETRLLRKKAADTVAMAYREYRCELDIIRHGVQEYSRFMVELMKRRKAAVKVISATFIEQRTRQYAKVTAARVLADAYKSSLRTRAAIRLASCDYFLFIADEIQRRKISIRTIEAAYILKRDIQRRKGEAALVILNAHKLYRRTRSTVQRSVCAYYEYINDLTAKRRTAVQVIERFFGCRKAKRVTKRRAAKVIANAYAHSCKIKFLVCASSADYSNFAKALAQRRIRAVRILENAFLSRQGTLIERNRAVEVIATAYVQILKQRAVIVTAHRDYVEYIEELSKQRRTAVNMIEKAFRTKKAADGRRLWAAEVISSVYSCFTAQKSTIRRARSQYNEYIESVKIRRSNAMRVIEESFRQRKILHAKKRDAEEVITSAISKYCAKRAMIQAARTDYDDYIKNLIRKRTHAIHVIEKTFHIAKKQISMERNAAAVIIKAYKSCVCTRDLIQKAVPEYAITVGAASAIEVPGRTHLGVKNLDEMGHTVRTIQTWYQERRGTKSAVKQAEIEQRAYQNSKILGERAGLLSLKEMYQARKMAEVGLILEKLWKETQKFSAHCGYLISQEILDVIICLIREADQSPIGMNARMHSLKIVENLSRDKSATKRLAEANTLFEALVDCAEMFRQVDSIVSVAITTLRTISSCPDSCDILRKDTRSRNKLMRLKRFLTARINRHARYAERKKAAATALDNAERSTKSYQLRQAQHPTRETVNSLRELCDLLE